MSPRPAALDFADIVLDHDSHRSWDTPAPAVGGDYGRTLERARERSGADEAVLTGEGRIAGRRVALLLGEFAFLAGSVGTVAADRLVRAVRRATAERLPVLAAPVSGGTRMQEGTPAFVRMAGIAAALAAHRAARLPYLVHLRHPTTGGVLASWGSLGQLTTAEPGALIGFLGPRVYEALHAAPFPAGVQRAENLAQHGVIDAVLSPGQLRGTLAATLDITDGVPHGGPPGGRPQQDPLPPQDIRRSVGLTRDPRRPGLAELLAAADPVVSLGGTGAGEREDALRIALARIGGAPCVVAGHDRSAPGSMGPAGLRTARRAMRLAEELRLPLLTVIDTAGARLTLDAEEGALAGEIARCLADLSRLTVPRLSLLLGEGAGGAALALLPADRTLAAEHAWLAPLPPEGASAILYRTTARAAELAQEQRIGAAELLDDGIVHRILPEPLPAGEDRDGFTARLVAALGWELRALHRAARAAGATGAAA